MFRIGCHLSCARGWRKMGAQAAEIGANTFQFFSRNPRGGAARAADPEDLRAYLEFAADHDLRSPLAHAPYTMNLCSPKEELRDFARRVLAEDIERLENVPGAMYNLHPGSHVKQGRDRGIELIAEGLNAVLRPGQRTLTLLETMAGKGSEIGSSFRDLREIIDRVEHSGVLGVCLDTCHVHDGGYDVTEGLDQTLEEFDRVVGLDRLKAVHLNDSKNARGSRKDRHEKIGEGELGTAAFERIINHPALRDLPFYLETPNETDGYAREISLLRSLRERE